MIYEREKRFPLNKIAQNALKNAVKRAQETKSKVYVVIRVKRGEGKTYSITEFLGKIFRNNECVPPEQAKVGNFLKNKHALFLASSKEQAVSNLESNGFLEKFLKVNTDPNIIGLKAGLGYNNRATGSTVLFGGFANDASQNRLRGKHPDFIVQDEAQDINNKTVDKWIAIVDDMGSPEGVVCVIMGTGSSYTNNLMSYVESRIKSGEYAGEIIHMTCYDLYRLNPCRQRRKAIRRKISSVTEFQMVYGPSGKQEKRITLSGWETAKFIREWKANHFPGDNAAVGDLAYPGFSSKNEVSDIDPLQVVEPLIVADWGRVDAIHIKFFSIEKDGRVIQYDELNSEGGNKLPGNQDLLVLEKMQELGIVTILDPGDGKNKIPTFKTLKRFEFLGDQNGNGVYWNDHFDRYHFAVSQVGTSKDGINSVNEMFRMQQLLICERCTKSIQRLLVHRLSTDRSGDIDLVHNNSHALVGFNYMALSEFVPRMWTAVPALAPPVIKPQAPISDEGPRYSVPLLMGKAGSVSVEESPLALFKKLGRY